MIPALTAGSGAIAWSLSSSEKKAMDNDFRLYLSKKYVEKHPDEEKKTELAVEILEDKLNVYEGKIPGNRITLITDTTYAVKRVLTPAREKGLIYAGKLKFTHEGGQGLLQGCAGGQGAGQGEGAQAEEENESKPNVARAASRTCKTGTRYKKSRWNIEEMHRELKYQLSLENTCAWKKEPLLVHYTFVFFLWWLFEVRGAKEWNKQRRRGCNCVSQH